VSGQPLPIALSDRSAPALHDCSAGVLAMRPFPVINHTGLVAVEVLILVAESNGGPTMLARIGVMRALNRNVERTFNPSRKDPHWGKRKLKRDQ
jgi:hypothetical protein